VKALGKNTNSRTLRY